MTKTKIDYAAWKKELLPFWQDGLPYKAYFTVKTAYSIKGEGPFVRVFENELSTTDMYCEFITLDEQLHHGPNRVLYKLPYNPNFAAKYDLIDKKTDVYLVPLKDFVEVSANTKGSKYVVTPASKATPKTYSKSPVTATPEKVDFTGTKAQEEKLIPVMGMSVKDLFAVIHKIPVADNDEINQLIHKYL